MREALDYSIFLCVCQVLYFGHLLVIDRGVVLGLGFEFWRLRMYIRPQCIECEKNIEVNEMAVILDKAGLRLKIPFTVIHTICLLKYYYAEKFSAPLDDNLQYDNGPFL